MEAAAQRAGEGVGGQMGTDGSREEPEAGSQDPGLWREDDIFSNMIQ